MKRKRISVKQGDSGSQFSLARVLLDLLELLHLRRHDAAAEKNEFFRTDYGDHLKEVGRYSVIKT
ncbi:hypothetical protein [Burkholderia sp. PU8-34]